jgi:hypothetical protein
MHLHHLTKKNEERNAYLVLAAAQGRGDGFQVSSLQPSILPILVSKATAEDAAAADRTVIPALVFYSIKPKVSPPKTSNYVAYSAGRINTTRSTE